MIEGFSIKELVMNEIAERRQEGYIVPEYALDWTPDGLKFYVDGRLIAKTDESPDYEMCMYLGLYTACDWDGGPDNGIYPKTFSVDYIRVYQHSVIC